MHVLKYYISKHIYVDLRSLEGWTLQKGVRL